MSGGHGITSLLSTQNLCRKKCDTLALEMAVFPFSFALWFVGSCRVGRGILSCESFLD